MISVVQFGTLAYADGLRLQRKLVDAVVPKSAPRNALLAALF